MMTSRSIGGVFRRMSNGGRPDPVRDWIMLASVALVALVAIIVWNAISFNLELGEDQTSTPSQATAPLINQKTLDDVRAVFASRSIEEVRYVEGSYRYVDPSQ